MEKDRAKRFAWTGENGDQPFLLTNARLQCRDCVHCMAGSVIECGKYEEKPGYVLYGTRPCRHYEKNAAEAEQTIRDCGGPV